MKEHIHRTPFECVDKAEVRNFFQGVKSEKELLIRFNVFREKVEECPLCLKLAKKVLGMH